MVGCQKTGILAGIFQNHRLYSGKILGLAKFNSYHCIIIILSLCFVKMLDKAKFRAYHCIISTWESWGPWCTNQLVDRERESHFYFRLKVRNAKCIWQMLSKNCQMYLSKMQNVYYSISFASTTCGSQGPLMQQPIGRESQLYFRFQAFRNQLSSSNWSKILTQHLLSGKVSFQVYFLSCCQLKQLTSFCIDIVDPSF